MSLIVLTVYIACGVFFTLRTAMAALKDFGSDGHADAPTTVLVGLVSLVAGMVWPLVASAYWIGRAAQRLVKSDGDGR